MTVDLTREQVLAYRWAAQGLARAPAEPAELAVLALGVQHSGAESVRLSLDARLPQPPPTELFGPGRPLALAWTFRGAPMVHRRAELNRLSGALWPLSEADAASRLDTASSVRKAGGSVLDALAQTVEALRRTVTKPTGKGAASTAVTKLLDRPLTRECRACRARHVYELLFRVASLPAGLELEPESPPALVPRPRPRRVEAVDPAAVRRTILDYLTLLGPAGPAEVAGYLEARRADLAGHWPEDELTEVRVQGRASWIPTARLSRLRRPPKIDGVRLLAPFDPWLQARDRDVIVPDKAVHKTLWPVLGRPGVVLAGGEVVGVWRPKASGAKLTVSVEPFVPLPPATRRAVGVEAERVGAVRGATTVTVAGLG